MTSKYTFIKVCGQTHAGTVDASLSVGAQFVGFIFHRRSPRSITPERAASIHSRFAARVGVFVDQNASEILRIMEVAHLNYAQFHGTQTIEDARRVGPERVIRTVWPERCGNAETFQRLLDSWAPFCAFYLADAGQHVGSGGTGHTWDVSCLAHVRFPHPWILAGGLNARNIPELLAQCHPDGIDLNSGVELAPGLKDTAMLLAAVHATRRSCPARKSVV